MDCWGIGSVLVELLMPWKDRQIATWESSEATSGPSPRDRQGGQSQKENQGLCGISVGLAVSSSTLRGWGGFTAQACSQALRLPTGGREEVGSACAAPNTLLV